MSHIELYGALRRAILARHFALGRFNRANHFTNDNHFGEMPPPGSAGPTRVGCLDLDSGPAPVRNGVPLYEHPSGLLGREELKNERWRVFRHERANPLMMTGLRLVSLAMEHRLGHVDSAALVRLVLSTLDGEEKFDIKPGTQSGAVLTMRGKGVPRLRSSQRGDLHVHVEVRTPVKLDETQEHLLRELAALRGEEVSVTTRGSGLFGKVRDAFGGR